MSNFIFLGVGIHGASGTPLMPPTYTTTKMRPKSRGGTQAAQKAEAQFGSRQSAACPISGRTCFSVAATVSVWPSAILFGCRWLRTTAMFLSGHKWLFCLSQMVLFHRKCCYLATSAVVWQHVISWKLHADYNNTGGKDRASKLCGPARPNLRNVPKIRK